MLELAACVFHLFSLQAYTDRGRWGSHGITVFIQIASEPKGRKMLCVIDFQSAKWFVHEVSSLKTQKRVFKRSQNKLGGTLNFQSLTCIFCFLEGGQS